MSDFEFAAMPDQDGFFGEYGGQIIPPELKQVMDEINDAYEVVRQKPEFINELDQLNRDYVGRPSPVYHAKRLSDKLGGAQIYLKREDLNHTGAHKINHCLGEALLAKYMGKTKVIAETGAGQHGVALATACALVGLPCEIHMGQVDVEKEAPNVTKMKILGCNLVPVTMGTATLKDAVDSAFMEYLKDPQSMLYAIGSVVGPIRFRKWCAISRVLSGGKRVASSWINMASCLIILLPVWVVALMRLVYSRRFWMMTMLPLSVSNRQERGWIPRIMPRRWPKVCPARFMA